MKIEQLIVQHLYNTRKVSLQHIGTFLLSPDISLNTDNDKEGILPENAITFEYNTRAPEDESLIDFIVQQTRKIRPLATSDLESYSILGREYLNIGKPFHIEGLGTLQKSQTGQYEFFQGHTVNPRLEPTPAALREKEDDEISFSTVSHKPKRKNGLLILLAVIFLGLTAAAIVYLMNRNEVVEPVEENTAVADSTELNTDTVAIAPVTDTLSKPMIPGDTSIFKVVIKEFPSRDLAEKEYNKLTSYGHKILMYQADSSKYVVSFPFNIPLADTTRVKDSLQRFFGTKAYVVQ